MKTKTLIIFSAIIFIASLFFVNSANAANVCTDKNEGDYCFDADKGVGACDNPWWRTIYCNTKKTTVTDNSDNISSCSGKKENDCCIYGNGSEWGICKDEEEDGLICDVSNLGKTQTQCEDDYAVASDQYGLSDDAEPTVADYFKTDSTDNKTTVTATNDATELPIDDSGETKTKKKKSKTVSGDGGWSLSSIAGFGLPEGSVSGIVRNVLSWMLGIFGLLGIIGFIISGTIYLTSTGDDEMITKAKRAMTFSIVGVLVGLIGFVVIQAIDYVLRGSSYF